MIREVSCVVVYLNVLVALRVWHVVREHMGKKK